MKTKSAGAPSVDARAPIVHEVHEFVRLAPGDWVMSRHCRTIYHEDGRISQELAPAERLLVQAVHALRGEVCKESPDALHASFERPEDARRCANLVSAHYGKDVELAGSQLVIPL